MWASPMCGPLACPKLVTAEEKEYRKHRECMTQLVGHPISGSDAQKNSSISSILYGEYIYIYIISLCKHLPSIHKSEGKWLIHGIPNKYPRDVRCMNGVDY